MITVERKVVTHSGQGIKLVNTFLVEDEGDFQFDVNTVALEYETDGISNIIYEDLHTPKYINQDSVRIDELCVKRDSILPRMMLKSSIWIQKQTTSWGTPTLTLLLSSTKLFNLKG